MIYANRAAWAACTMMLGLTLAGCPADDESEDGAASDDTSTGSIGDGDDDDDDDDDTTGPGDDDDDDTTGPGDDDDDDTGPGDDDDDDTTGPGDDDDDDDTTDGGGEPVTVVGHVTRAETAVIAEGNDGVGTLYVGVFPGCDPKAALASFAIVQDADLSADGTVDFEILGLGSGEYDFRVFLDDDGDASAIMPAPGPGDLVADPDLEDEGATCFVVDVGEEDVDVDIALTFAIPGA